MLPIPPRTKSKLIIKAYESLHTIQDLLLPWILLINIPFLLTKSAGPLLAFKIDQAHSLVKAFACVTLSTQKALSLPLERPFVKNPSEWCPGHFLIHCPTSIFFKDCAQPVFQKIYWLIFWSLSISSNFKICSSSYPTPGLPWWPSQ